MKLINDHPAVVRADLLEELRDEHVRLVQARCGRGLEGLVPRRRVPAPVASTADGGSR